MVLLSIREEYHLTLVGIYFIYTQSIYKIYTYHTELLNMSTDIKMSNDELTESLNNKVDLDKLNPYLYKELHTSEDTTEETKPNIWVNIEDDAVGVRLRRVDTKLEQGVAPENIRYYQMQYLNKDHKEVAVVQMEVTKSSDGKPINSALLIARDPETGLVAKSISIHYTTKKDGTSGTTDDSCCYTSAPQPIDTSNGDNIATTKFVNSKLTKSILNVSNIIDTDKPIAYTFPEGGTYSARVEFTGDDVTPYIENKVYSGGDVVTPTSSNIGYTQVNVIGIKIK